MIEVGTGQAQTFQEQGHTLAEEAPEFVEVPRATWIRRIAIAYWIGALWGAVFGSTATLAILSYLEAT